MENKLPHPAPKGDWKTELRNRSYAYRCGFVSELDFGNLVDFISQLIAEREKEAYERGKKEPMSAEEIRIRMGSHNYFMAKSAKDATLSAYKVVADWAERNIQDPDCGQNPKYPADQCTPTCGHNKILKALQSFLKDKTKE